MQGQPDSISDQGVAMEGESVFEEAGSHPESGMRTSDFYKTKNIPKRFDHPDWFEGYNTKTQHSFYQTSANVYG